MREFWILFKVNIINTIGLNKLKKKFAKSGTFLKIGIPIIFIFLFLIIAAFLFFYVYMFDSLYIMTQQYDGIMILALVIGSIFCFITSLTKANSYLFEAKDYDLLLAMPINPKAIIASKLSNLFLLNYLSFGAIYIPSTVYYGIFVNPPIYFYLLALIVFIIGPFLLVTISTFFSYLIGLILSKFKYKNFIQSIFMVVFLIVIMYGSMSMNQVNALDTEKLKEYVEQINNTLLKIYYPARWAMSGLKGNVLELLLYIAISVIPFIIFIYIIGHNFLKASERAKRVYTDKNFKLKKQKTQGQKWALIKREFKTLFSNSAVVMNVVVGQIMSTIFVVMFLFGSGSMGFNLEEVDIDAAVAILIALSLFMSGVNPTTSSTISLEGKRFWILKSAPISTTTTFISKISVNSLLSLPFTIINVILSVIVLPLRIDHIFFLLFIPIAYNLLSGLLGLLFNLMFPKMEWDNPIKAVKQGMSVFFTLISDWVLIALIVFAFIVGQIIHFTIGYLFVIAIILVFISIVSLILFTYGKKKYMRIPA